ncbi:integrase [Trinickia mobilis]|uniref:integrase n=1 Tax=Trinickia mobilis TaxID=2816356 RepID=UPI001F5DD9A5|nr:integrase [Trinickia mobilis]
MPRSETKRRAVESENKHDSRAAGPSEEGARRRKKSPTDDDTCHGYVRPRAFELLAAQPVTLAALSRAERDLVVVTAVADEQGNEYVVSRIGHPVWHLASEVEAKNVKGCTLDVLWPIWLPEALLDDARAALYCAMRRGPNGTPWSGSTVQRAGKEALYLLRHITSLGLRTFSEVRALHLSDYIESLKPVLQPVSIRRRVELVDLIWRFSTEVFFPLREDPWAGQSFLQACGLNDHDDSSPVGRTAKTPVIPLSVQRTLFAYCEAVLDRAEELFQARDAGRISMNSYGLLKVRDAVLYLTQVTSGMRNSECTGITNGCWRSEVRKGVTFHWVRTREIKTKKGVVEFLVPPETIRALTILQRYAAPLQARLAEEARWLEAQLHQGADEDGWLEDGTSIAAAVGRLNHIREIGQHMFLAFDKSTFGPPEDSIARVDVVSVVGCNTQLKSLARAAGSDWALANHQCRRTFSYNVANSRLGRMGLVFLKWQLKHATMSWTELYAANPLQDLAIYRELEEEQTRARIDLMEGWMQADAPLSGGAGKKLLQTRAIPVRDLDELLLHTAESIEIRSTGHAWCLSGTRVCNGQGVYEPTNCANCSQSVIDLNHAAAWQAIHLDNLRLAAVIDCGPAVVQKAQRAIQRSKQVLRELGVPLPSAGQRAAYAKSEVVS